MTPKDMTALADKIASARDFTGFAWKNFAASREPIEITDVEKNTIIAALRAAPPVAEGAAARDCRPAPDALTYYVEGRDAEYFEKLGDAEFAWRITRASQDIVDNDFGPIEQWMPITAMLDGAAKRIVALRAPPSGSAGALWETAIEQCAKFVEQHQEAISETSQGSERYLSPRKVGNQMGLAYVDGIRTLAAAPQTQPWANRPACSFPEMSAAAPQALTDDQMREAAAQARADSERVAIDARIDPAIKRIPVAAAPQAQEPPTLHGMIAAIYGNLDAEDCARIDREWAKMRGYILPTDGTCTVTRPHHRGVE